jgi:hypothetical protein
MPPGDYEISNTTLPPLTHVEDEPIDIATGEVSTIQTPVGFNSGPISSVPGGQPGNVASGSGNAPGSNNFLTDLLGFFSGVKDLAQAFMEALNPIASIGSFFGRLFGGGKNT